MIVVAARRTFPSTKSSHRLSDLQVVVFSNATVARHPRLSGETAIPIATRYASTIACDRHSPAPMFLRHRLNDILQPFSAFHRSGKSSCIARRNRDTDTPPLIGAPAPLVSGCQIVPPSCDLTDRFPPFRSKRRCALTHGATRAASQLRVHYLRCSLEPSTTLLAPVFSVLIRDLFQLCTPVVLEQKRPYALA